MTQHSETRKTEVLLTLGKANPSGSRWMWTLDEWAEGEHVAVLAEGRAPGELYAEFTGRARAMSLGLEMTSIYMSPGDSYAVVVEYRRGAPNGLASASAER